MMTVLSRSQWWRSAVIITTLLVAYRTVQPWPQHAQRAAPGHEVTVLSSAPRQPLLAFATSRCTGATQSECTSTVTIANLDGTQPRPVATYPGSATVDTLALSPDGTRLAYIVATLPGMLPASQTLYLADARTLMVSDLGAYHAVSWSPDSQHLALSSDAGIVVAAADGSHATVVAQGLDPQWSPDGSQIAYEGAVIGGPSPSSGILSMHPDGTSTRVIVTDRALALAAFPDGSCPAAAIDVFLVSWSPDGRHLLTNGDYCNFADPDSPNAIVSIIDPLTGTITHLTGIAGCCADPSWSPDSTQIAESSSTGGIAIVTIAGATRSTGIAGILPQWTPDGQHLTSGQQLLSGPFLGTLELHLANLDGTGDTPLPSTIGFVEGGAGQHTYSIGPSPLIARYLGARRTDTAVDVARHAYSSASTVVIARDDVYADALAGAPLAAKLNAPLLLTDPESLPASVCGEITELGATTAVILGDATAISATVQGQLAGCGIASVRRYQGATRFDTAAAIAAQLPAGTVYLTEGIDPDPVRGWPDAVAVSSLAADQQRPILLVTTNTIPAATMQALRVRGTTQATIIGGSQVVSDAVTQQLAAMGLHVTRISGADRYATSAAVATGAAQSGLASHTVWLATGDNWPDALAAGPAAAHTGGQLLLVDGATLDNSPDTKQWLASNMSVLTSVTLVGGPDVLSPLVGMQWLRLATT